MQYDRKSTKIKVDSDRPTAIASGLYGANVNCLAFNADYIGYAAPLLHVELIRLYEKCRKLEYIQAHDEDYEAANKAMLEFKK